MVIVWATGFGLVVGSFLNVAIFRLPKEESLVTPRSRCPACGTPIRAVENIPLLVQDAIASLLLRSGQASEAVRRLPQSVKIRPDRVEPFRVVALLLEQQGRATESLRMLRRISDLAPNGLTTRETLDHMHRPEEAGADLGSSLAGFLPSGENSS